MSDFHDPELRQHLGRLSGPYPDDNEAFAAWQRRVGQARRRRTMAVTTGTAMSLIVAVVAIAALQGPRGQTFKPADTSETTTATSDVATTEPSTTDSSLPSTTAPTTTPVPETVPATDLAAETVAPVDDTMPISGEQPPAATTNKGGSTQPTQPKPASTPPQEPTKTIVSDGGSITVRVDDGKLKLDDIDENDGYEARESDSSKNKVEVTFSSEDHRWEITAWLVDGVIYENVVDKGGNNHSDSYGGGGDHGDGEHGDGD